MRKKLFAVLESIKVQNDFDFKEELITICNTLIATYKDFQILHRDKTLVINDRENNTKIEITDKTDLYSQYNIRFNNALLDLKNILQQRFNIKELSIVVTPEHTNIVSIYIPEASNIFFNIAKNDIVDVAYDRAIGVIDLEKATLKGDLSNKEIILLINLDIIYNMLDYKGDELAAILMHEVGHLFSFIETLTRITHVNSLLEDLAKDKKLLNDPNKIKLVLIKSIETLDNEYVYKDENLPVLSITLIRKYIKTSKKVSFHSSELHEFENLSDLFATRMGFGKELVLAFSKLTKYEDSNMVIYNNVLLEVNIAGYYTKMALKILQNLTLISGAIAVFSFAAFSVILVPVIAFSLFMLLNTIVGYLSGMNSFNVIELDEHPNTVNRINRIRKEIVRQVKVLGKAITKEEADNYLADLDYLEGIYESSLNSALIKDEKVKKYFINMLNTNKGNKVDGVLIENILENLANNELFVDSLRLRQLGA